MNNKDLAKEVIIGLSKIGFCNNPYEPGFPTGGKEFYKEMEANIAATLDAANGQQPTQHEPGGNIPNEIAQISHYRRCVKCSKFFATIDSNTYECYRHNTYLKTDEDTNLAVCTWNDMEYYWEFKEHVKEVNPKRLPHDNNSI